MIAENPFLGDLEKLHKQLKIHIVKLLFCLLIMTSDTDYGHTLISNIRDTGNLPEVKCRNDPVPPWTPRLCTKLP